MKYRDPFSGRFTTRAKYQRAVQRIARERERAFRREDDKALKRLTEKARKYPALPTARKPRRPSRDARARQGEGDDFSEDMATEWEFGLTYEGD
jgi:hypothetical protein